MNDQSTINLSALGLYRDIRRCWLPELPTARHVAIPTGGVRYERRQIYDLPTVSLDLMVLSDEINVPVVTCETCGKGS